MSLSRYITSIVLSFYAILLGTTLEENFAFIGPILIYCILALASFSDRAWRIFGKDGAIGVGLFGVLMTWGCFIAGFEEPFMWLVGLILSPHILLVACNVKQDEEIKTSSFLACVVMLFVIGASGVSLLN